MSSIHAIMRALSSTELLSTSPPIVRVVLEENSPPDLVAILEREIPRLDLGEK